jgi:O-antigen/teichoic acid export membrane protein
VSLGRIAAALIQAGTVVLVARNATTSEFGVFAAAYGVVIVAQVLSDFGLSTFITQERSRSIDSPLIRGAIRLNGIIAFLALLGGLLACVALAPFTDGYSLIFIPYVVWTLAERNAAVWLAVAFADGDAWLNMTNLVARRLLTLVGLLALVALGVDAVLAFGIAAAVAGVCSLVVARLYVRRRLRGGASRDSRAILRSSIPFWSNLIAGQLRNLDVLVAGVSIGATQAGLYGAGARITGPLRILPDALASALLPAASRENFRPSPRLLRQIGVFSLVATAFGVVGVLVVPYVVQPLLGAQYAGAEAVIQLTVLGLPFASLVSVEASLLQGLGLKAYVARVAFAATALCLCGVAVGGLLGGAVGAMIGYTAGVLGQAIVLTGKTWLVVRDPAPRVPATARVGPDV